MQPAEPPQGDKEQVEEKTHCEHPPMPEFSPMDQSKIKEDLKELHSLAVGGKLKDCAFVIDTQGTLDECFTLSLALTFPGLNVVAVTCVDGRIPVDKGVANVLRVLALHKIQLPVYKGSPNPYLK